MLRRQKRKIVYVNMFPRPDWPGRPADGLPVFHDRLSSGNARTRHLVACRNIIDYREAVGNESPSECGCCDKNVVLRMNGLCRLSTRLRLIRWNELQIWS